MQNAFAGYMTAACVCVCERICLRYVHALLLLSVFVCACVLLLATSRFVLIFRD